MSGDGVDPLRVLIHAPTAESLARARSNRRNLLASAPDAVVEIVANAAGVTAALDGLDPESDAATVLCENTLSRLNMPPPQGRQTTKAAILHIAERQRDGWVYVRA